jgi:hypothetical protein
VAFLAVLMTATGAGASPGPVLRYGEVWSPPLDLPSNYQPCCPSAAAFTTLPFTMDVGAAREAILTVRMRTNWADSKALDHTPNIIQQGRFVASVELKISIHSGPLPGDHHAQCRIAGLGGGVIDAQGPKSIDIADGRWHTITCIKYRDGVAGSSAQVLVDAVAGPLYTSGTPIGNVTGTGGVDLGGQGTVANKDSIDGEYASVSYTIE